MADLTKEISDLKAELEGYRVDLKNATSPEEKIMYGGLIKSRGDNLTELLKQQTEWSKVSVAPKGNRMGGAFIDRQVFFKHWRKVKDRIDTPFLTVCTLNENWGFLSTNFPNRTAGWGRCCDTPRDRIVYDFLNHDKTLLLVTNQHVNITHP
eukprot:gene11596-12992_t